ncbi:hypothetical protein [Thermomonospora catenispora]|uniref:hypothetical protein n=1 Tax=Thermomonospora catenispora TaxID=2493090 RepID=UPI00111CB507|nr:hypothetical protein [Thermomonospora catenispora]TNY36572.1 hypothetical protein EIO00_12305 [Thermomonospora catenispora]
MNTDPFLSVRRRVDWPMACLLTAIALVRPLFSIAGWSEALGKPATPLLLTAAITLLWILIGAFGRIREPLPTLICAGAAYAVVAIVASGILSPILTGELQGPLATPIAVFPVIAVNVLWGAFCGVCAQALRRLRR